MKIIIYSALIVILIFLLTNNPKSTKLHGNLQFSFEKPKKSDSLITGIDPLPSELLPEPILLPECSGIVVIEWRPTQNYESTTNPSFKTIKILNDTCSKAVSNFTKFITFRHLEIKNSMAFHQNICLMPFSLNKDGHKFRNLNDILFRFSSRYKPNDLPVLGYTHYANHTIFIRNDVLLNDGMVNGRFVTTFSHELFHAMSWHYRVMKNASSDEELARQFTEFLHLGR